MTVRLPPGFNPNPTGQTLETAVENFRRSVLTANPTANSDFVRAIGEDIVKRANILSTSAILRFVDVALFLLERAEYWVIRDQLPLDQIGGKMPKNIKELGMLKLAEGSAKRRGAPLTNAEIAAVRNAKPNIIH